MHQRVDVKENEKEEDVHRSLDFELGVSAWGLPGGGFEAVEIPQRVTEDGLKVPSWWVDDEEASQGFLTGRGVAL